MKIIKNAMSEPVAVTCEGCNSELEYVYSDIKRDEIPYLFSKRIERYVVCPVCKNNIYIRKAKDEDAVRTAEGPEAAGM